ncbi:MAG TPA: RsmE family RNA methyltransferase, partial [Flavipsychrobacter sp.]|nr:RsmE family RNA methyltransferase [Flavipsychrobacter sp.]
MTSLPQFFKEEIPQEGNEIKLDEDAGRHIVQVLRMGVGEKLQLTDGKGKAATVTIIKTEKKNCSVVINDIVFHQPKKAALHLGIAFTKNTSRNEWLLEKATELGVGSIIPIVAARTIKEKIRYDRWRNILVSALLQSQQYYLPKLHEATQLKDIIQLYNKVPQKLVAHCIDGYEKLTISKMLNPG